MEKTLETLEFLRENRGKVNPLAAGLILALVMREEEQRTKNKK